MKKAGGLPAGLGMAGFFIGGLLGYLARPSAFLLGQPSFDVVITRGATLEGLDQLLVPIAQRGFNLMVAGAVIGALAGLAVGYFLGRSKAS